jgi:hypothetical protein
MRISVSIQAEVVGVELIGLKKNLRIELGKLSMDKDVLGILSRGMRLLSKMGMFTHLRHRSYLIPSRIRLRR